MDISKSSHQELSVDDQLMCQLDAAIFDLSRAINREPLPDCLPEEEEEAVTGQIVLIAHTIAERQGLDWLLLAQNRINEHIMKDPETNGRLAESDLFDESYRSAEVVGAILASTVVSPPAGSDFDENVAKGRAMTRAFHEASQKLSSVESY
jgi:hypothetical protein